MSQKRMLDIRYENIHIEQIQPYVLERFLYLFFAGSISGITLSCVLLENILLLFLSLFSVDSVLLPPIFFQIIEKDINVLKLMYKSHNPVVE